MNPQDQLARQAILARLTGSPMPAATQIAPGAQVAPPAPVTPPMNPVQPGDQQLGDMTPDRQPSEHDKLAKAVLPGTAHQDPHIQALSKVLLQKLIPYLGN